MHSRRLTTLAALALLASPLAHAQATERGAIEGILLDPLARPVADGALTLTSNDTGAVLRQSSGADGQFQFPSLAPGTYTLQATAPSFAVWQASTEVAVGGVTTVRATLPLGQRKEVVQVDAVAPVLDTATPGVSTTLDAGAVHNLPTVSRRWSDFALLTPAVTPDADANGLLSFRGIGALLNNNTVDGADNNQAFFSEERGRTTVAYSNSEAAVEEFQVNTSNYGAEYGRAAGGVINTVTRSGTNSLHGELFFYSRNGAWAARNAFASSTSFTASAAGDAAATTPVQLRNTLTQGGASVGGPLRRDKLFGFFTYDRYHRDFPGIARATNPAKLFQGLSAAQYVTLAGRIGVSPAEARVRYNSVLDGLASLLGDVPRTADQNLYFPKLDWQVSERAHLTLQWNHLQWNSPNGVQTSPTATYGSNSFGNSNTRADTAIARLAYFLTPNVLNEARVQYGRDLETEQSNPPSPFEASLAHNIYGRPPQVDIETYGFRFGNPPVLNRAAYPDEHRYEVTDAITDVRGRHTLKFGFGLDYVDDYSDALYNGNGTYVYANVLNFATDYLAPSRCDLAATGTGALPCWSYYTQSFGQTTFDFQSADYSGFVSDEWKATPRLTVSLGLRYEYEQLPDTNKTLVNPDIPETAKLPHDRNNYGPRVGLAWDPVGHGSTVLRAGYGVYYGRIINSTAFSALSATGAAGAQRSYYFTPLAIGAPPFPFVFSGTPYLSVAPTAVYFDPRFQNPQIHQAEISLQQKLNHNTTLTASGLYSAGRELPSYIDSNIDLNSAQSLTYTVVDPEHQGPLPSTYSTSLYTARLNPNYSQITRIFSETNSKYEAGVLRVDHNLTGALDLHGSFTFSHAIDWNQNATAFTDTNDVLDPANLQLEYGNSNFDIRRRLTGGMLLRTPWRVHGLLGTAANGWELAPTAEVRDGLPYSLQTSGSVPALRTLNDVNQRVTLSGLGASINGSGGATRIAQIGRNTFRYPGVVNANLRISKTTELAPRVHLELLGESFNLLNHQNITSIDATGYAISNSSAVGGQPRLTWQTGQFGVHLNGNNTNLYSDRQIQIAARLRF